ncbi:MAG: carbohydrate kinase family protein [Bacteroidota bacterium]
MDRSQIIKKVLAQLDRPVLGKALVGVDGYIDRIQHPVKAQLDIGNSHFPTLEDFGGHIIKAAGKSAQVELDTSIIKPGGNAPIMSHAMGAVGISTTCLGTLGEGEPQGVFRSMSKNCELLTLGKPAESNALEFNDGKLILSDLSSFARMDWHLVKDQVGLDQLRRLTEDCDVLALVGWCNPPHATAIWRGMLEEVIAFMDKKPKVFFDLADPSKKSDEQIIEVVNLMNEYAQTTEVILGLNENETIKLYHAFERVDGKRAGLQDLPEICQYVFEQMEIKTLVVHPLDRCLVTDIGGTRRLSGKLVDKPKVSTGGGDNFNAGFCYGLLAGLPVEECMALAMATSGAYVQNGNSPGISELKEFLEEMKN